MTRRNRPAGMRTRAIHAGERPGPATRDAAPAIHMSSTFRVESATGFSAHALSDDSPYLYGRWSNPTVDMLGRKIASLEGTEDCACFASGMGAASAIFLTFLSSGDHAVVSDVSYAGIAELARDTLPRLGIEVSLVDMSDHGAVANALRPNTRLVHVESPANPIMRLTDLRAVADLAHAAGAVVSCDSTYQTPVATRPCEHGVDLVLHSVTKYIGGHGDAIGGAVAGSRELVARLRTEACIHHGGVMSPFNAWLVARGAATLPIRMRCHQENALALAGWLEAHPMVTRVLYPGLESHPQHRLACRQMENFGGMLTFQVGDRKTGERVAESMMHKFEVIHYAVSLGHQRSLVFWLPTDDLNESSFRLQGAQLDGYRAYAGDGIFRFSVGLEDPGDLIGDLETVLG